MSPGTPTADLTDRNRRHSLWKSLLVGALLGGGGAALTVGLVARSGLIPPLLDPMTPWSIAALVLAVPLPLFVHEAGHVVGGWLAGFRFALFVAGPLLIERRGERLRVRLHTHWSLYGGLAASVPPDDRNLPARLMWMVAAGPAASALLTMGAFATLAATWSLWPAARFPLFVLGLSAFGNLLAVTVPATTGGFLTDRTRFLQLRRGGREAQLVADLALLGARHLAGQRPREWPREPIERLAAARGFDATVGQISFVAPYRQDVGDLAGAAEIVRRALADLHALPTVLHATVRLEAAFLLAMTGSAPSDARALLDQAVAAPFIEAWQRHRAEAAVRRAEGRVEDAAKVARRGLAALDSATPSGLVPLVRDQLTTLALS